MFQLESEHQQKTLTDPEATELIKTAESLIIGSYYQDKKKKYSEQEQNDYSFSNFGIHYRQA